MADRFIEQSKEIANNFIQNIVFIDDKAYKEDSTNNAFSALDVSNAFAKTGKICAIYAPKSVSDIDSYNVILKKADVVILDWYLDIERDVEQQLEPDADADNDEPRGEFTLKLLQQLTSDAGTDKLKLIIVYTGETGISDIKDAIINNIDSESFKDNDYTIKSSNVCIIIRAKAGKNSNTYRNTSH